MKPAASTYRFDECRGIAGWCRRSGPGIAIPRRFRCTRSRQKLRVLLVRDGPTWVFLRAGHHDEICDLAERRTFVVPVDGHPGLISIRPTPPDSGDSAPDRVAEPRQSPYDNKPTIVEHWTTGELARAGFSEDEIDRLRRTTQDTLLEVWPTITDEKLDRVIECSEMSPDEWFARPLCRRDRRRVEAQAVSRCHRGARRTCGSIVAVVAAGAAAPDGGSDRRLDDLPPSRPACPCGTSLQWAGSCPGVRGYGQDGGRAPPGCGPGKAVHWLRRSRSESAAVVPPWPVPDRKPSTISATNTGAAMRTRWPCAKAPGLVWCALATCLARLPM